MMKMPPTLLIRDNDFHSAWSRAIKSVLREGIDLVIGDKANPKPIKDVCAIIELYGNAISQIENRELHSSAPFQHIDPYCAEFTREYLKKYLEKPEHDRFSYTYFDRFARYFGRDQCVLTRDDLRDQLVDGISSNRHQLTTWDLYVDMESSVAPCLQRVWVRHLGDRNVEVHLAWRSRDGYGAFQANLIALIDMINREILKPNNCKISKIVDFSNSFHIYEHDITCAKHIRLVPTNPQKQS